MAVTRRVIGGVSRRVGRPELLAAVSPQARQSQYDALAVNAVLAGTLRADATYVDVGTNRGQVLREALRVAPHGRHVAFEPIPALAAEVARAFPSVDCRALALGERSQTTQFCHFTALDGWSGLRRQPQVSDERGRPQYITVQVSTLDEQLAGIVPAVLKIDVEGAERGVLEGARATLARARPLVILEHTAEAAALYDTTSDAVWDLAYELGYRIFAVTGEGPFARGQLNAATGTVNWLLVPR